MSYERTGTVLWPGPLLISPLCQDQQEDKLHLLPSCTQLAGRPTTVQPGVLRMFVRKMLSGCSGLSFLTCSHLVCLKTQGNSLEH